MRVLLVGMGEFWHIAAFFRKGLESLGIEYSFVDEGRYLHPLDRSFLHKVAYRLMLRQRPLTYWAFNREVLEQARQFRPEVVLITKGKFVSPKTLRQIKAETNAILNNYATDDPFNSFVSSRDMIAGIPFFDLYISTKRAIMKDISNAGCGRVEYIPFGYEPTLHFPEKPTTDTELNRYSSDIVFIGGADNDRYPIMKDLLSIPGLQLHLYGGLWNRDSLLKHYYQGYAFARDYRLALGGAKIDLCLVRRANRDGHVMRTFEVPACGGFMLADRTDEHLEFFEEDKEAVYFSSNEELVDKARYYLKHDSERQRIAEAGYKRAISSNYTYHGVLKQILSLVH